jgi:beta-glucanase (GH16 family)
MIRPTNTLRFALSTLCLLAASLTAHAGSVPASSVLLAPATADIAAIKLDKEPVLSLTDVDGAKVLRIDFPAGDYPGINLPVPGAWDLSAFTGVEAEISNVGTTRLNIGLRVDNSGDWKQSPWNTNNVWIAPGESKTIKVTFGQSYGRAGYALNPADISGVKLLADNPKEGSAILLKSIRAFGTATPVAAAPAVATPASSAPAAAGAVIFTPTADNIATIKTEQDPSLAFDASTGTPAIKLSFPNGGDYPGFDFPLTGGQLNLSAFAGVQATITNSGQSRLNVALRAGNPGDWQKSPWNTGNVWIAPGETKTLKVTFGQSYGHPGYALDASRVNVLKLYVEKPKADAVLLISNLAPFGTAAAAPVATSTSESSAAPASGTDATFSPSIGGDLLDLAKKGLSGFNFSDSSAIIAAGKVKVTFEAGSNYPNIQFPIPKGGWNLAAFGGIEVTVTNANDKKVTVLMRADNPGDWKKEPWNTERLLFNPGETKVLKLTFGQQNGAPGFPLNPARISAIQLFLERPKADTTLILADLKASGTPADAASSLSLTKPDDRNTPAVLPAWLGKRPPAELPGEWVKTLDENFDGTQLNSKLWTPRFPWDGPQPGQLQRYAPENVTVANGVASFKVEKKAGHENNDPALGSRDYTSGLIQSYGKWTQLYGYFEARIKVPYVRGLWPAFWMMPDRGAASGLEMWKRRDTAKGAMEIDIMEIISEWGPGRNSVATHWDGYGADHKQWGTTQIYYGSTPDGYHVFGLLWEPGKLTWYVDGKKVAEQITERVSNVPSYLKLNVQMGGWATKDVDVANLPATMDVDYTRAWQLKSRL